MIPGLNTHPSYSPTSVCEALACNKVAHHIAICRNEKCPHAFRREAAADEAMRDRQRIEDATAESVPDWVQIPACIGMDCVGLGNSVKACEPCPWSKERKAEAASD